MPTIIKVLEDMKTISLEDLKELLSDRNEKGEAWSSMANEYGTNPAVLWRIVHEGYVPRRKDIRKKLGLPELTQQEIYRDEKGQFVEHG